MVMRAPDGGLAGFSIDLWKAVAREANLTFDFIERPSLRELLASVQNREVDAAIAAISITSERETIFDFSLPVLESGLQILVRDSANTDAAQDGFLTVLTTPALYHLLGVLLLLAFLPVPFVWLAERRHAEGLVDPQSKPRGLFKAMWWSLATLAGQADEMPRSVVGRMFAIAWMLASVLFISYFTATTTTILTVRQLSHAIRGPGDLPGRRVGTIAGSTAATYLDQEGIAHTDFVEVDRAVAALERADVDAVVYDAPALQYAASHAGQGKVRVVEPVFRKQDYGILLPAGSTLRKPVNAALLRLRERGDYRAIHAKWFGQE